MADSNILKQTKWWVTIVFFQIEISFWDIFIILPETFISIRCPAHSRIHCWWDSQMSCESQLCADPLARKPHLGAMAWTSLKHWCAKCNLPYLHHDHAQVVFSLDMTRVNGHNLLVAGFCSLQVFDMVGVDVTQENFVYHMVKKVMREVNYFLLWSAGQ